jgi:hypothetical protein
LFTRLTDPINGSRPTGNHHPRCRRESICIAWFRASHPDGAAVHSTRENPTGATGPHAIAACPPLEATRPIDEGDDGFTPAGNLSTGGFRRLDAPSALSAPQSRPAIRPLAAQPSPFTISISMASRVEFARLRRRTAGFPRRVRERSELVFLWFPIIPLAVVITLCGHRADLHPSLAAACGSINFGSHLIRCYPAISAR